MAAWSKGAGEGPAAWSKGAGGAGHLEQEREASHLEQEREKHGRLEQEREEEQATCSKRAGEGPAACSKRAGEVGHLQYERERRARWGPGRSATCSKRAGAGRPPAVRERDPATGQEQIKAIAGRTRGFLCVMSVMGRPLHARHPLRRSGSRPAVTRPSLGRAGARWHAAAQAIHPRRARTCQAGTRDA